METLTLEEVTDVRSRFAQSREEAARLFREAFASAPPDIPPNERWRAHLDIQAGALLAAMQGVHLSGGRRIQYLIRESPERLAIPVVLDAATEISAVEQTSQLPGKASLFPFFTIERTVDALFEYWMLISELLGSAEWRMTTLIAAAAEYDAALDRVTQPQLVRPLFVSYLPAGEWRSDETALLDVTLYARGGEERIERRRLILDQQQEFSVHSRDVIVEGRGGVRAS